MKVKIKFSVCPIPAKFIVVNEKTIAATAIPFGATNAIKIFSLSKYLSLKANSMDKYLIKK